MGERNFLNSISILVTKMWKKNGILQPSLQRTKKPVSLIWPTYKSVFSRENVLPLFKAKDKKDHHCKS